MLRETLITDDLSQAARVLRNGGLVAFPTETVYGLGANALDAEAVARVFVAKGRPQDNPLIVHVPDLASVTQVTAALPDVARRLLGRFGPGPLTVVLARGSNVAPAVSAGLGTVAVRIPDHPAALELLRLAQVPVAAPSANRSGSPSATTWQAVREDLDGRIDVILKGEPSRVGLESTVVDCTGAIPVVLRHGGISLEALRGEVGDVLEAGGRSEASPGTRHPHYAPRASVVLVQGPSTEPSPDTAYIGMDGPAQHYAKALLCPHIEAYAQALYDFFRRCDASDIRRIECQRVASRGMGAALMDRLRRAEEATLNAR